MRIGDFKSQYVPSRQLEIYLPPEYDSAKNYPVIYMHDGQNVFDAITAYGGQAWEVDQIMDSLILAKRINPAIVVAIHNAKNRWSEYLPEACLFIDMDSTRPFPYSRPEIWDTGVYSLNYLRFIKEELKPFVDSNYTTASGANNTFIMGSSMGGLISAYALTIYPEVFGGAACLSTHWPALDGACVAYLAENLPIESNHKIYFDYGTENLDSLYEPYSIALDNVLKKRNISINAYRMVKVDGGDHNESSWRKRVYQPLLFLLGEPEN